MIKIADAAALKAYPKQSRISETHGIISADYYSHYLGDANEEHREGFIKGYEQAEKDLVPLINRLCEAILFEWKDAADLAIETLTQIKAREE